jgi:hypothetical protein
MNTGTQTIGWNDGMGRLAAQSVIGDAAIRGGANQEALSATGFEGDGDDVVLSNDEQIQLYVHAAWGFARVVALEKWDIDAQQIMKCLAGLEVYFLNAKKPWEALVTFCDRVVWGGVFATLMQSTNQDLWNCLLHPKGIYSNPSFTVTKQKVTSMKRRNPFYESGLPVLLKAYLAYLKQPGYKIVLDLNERLNEMGYGYHMRLFYALINAPVEG